MNEEPSPDSATCPTRDDLARLLEGEPGDFEISTLREHLYRCDHCRAVLDQMTDDPCLARRSPPDSRTSHAARVGAEVGPGLDRLLALRDHAGLAGAETTIPTLRGQGDLGFLERPGRNGALGRLDSYSVEALLGRGGMGLVFRARDESLDRTVAIKVLRPELANEQARERFVREARAAARVQNDHVVVVHSVANPPAGLPYLVMELVVGRSLADEIRARGRLEPRAAAEVVREAAEGIEAAHHAGLIHRDVKPANIMIDATTGRSKIMDFGLARVALSPSELTQNGAIPGTPAYMSPEQASGADGLDPRSDVYSLGVTLYEALTGEVPFRGTPHMLLKQVMEEEPRPPRRLNDAIPMELETICLKAMAKEPAQRYETARALADDLGRWSRGEPIEARPVGPVGRAWRWSKRNRRVAILAGAVLFLLIALQAGATVALIVIDRARRDAESQRGRADQNAAQAVRAEGIASERARVAGAQRLLALDTVGSLVNEMQQQLGASAGTLKLRRRLADVAIEKLKGIASDPAGDADVVLARIIANDRLGDLSYLAGQTTQAVQYHEAARDLARRLVDSQPDDIEPRRQLALALDKLGDLALAADRPAGAADYFQKAGAIRDGMPASYQNGATGRREKAVSVNKLGNVMKMKGDLPAARRYYETGLALTEGVSGGQPKQHISDLRFSTTRLGEVCLLLRDVEGAIRWFWKSFEYAERLRDVDPDDPAGARAVDLARNQLANALLRTGDATESIALDRLAVSGREAAAAANPANAEAQRDLAIAHSLLGDALLVANEFDAAINEQQRCLAIAEGLAARDPASFLKHGDIITTCDRLAGLHERTGQFGDAARLLERASQELERMVKLKLISPAEAAPTRDQFAIRTTAYRTASHAIRDPGVIASQRQSEANYLWRLRALALARGGDHQHAAQAAEAFRGTAAEVADTPLTLARVYSLCARAASNATGPGPDPAARERYAASAVAAMRRLAQTAPAFFLQVFEPDVAALWNHHDMAAIVNSARDAMKNRQKSGN